MPYEPLRRWYELLVLGQDPSTLVRPYAALRGWRSAPRGFHAGTAIGKARSAAQTVLTRLQQDAYNDLVAIEITTVPPHPGDAHRSVLRRRPTSERIVRRAVAARTLTGATRQPNTPTAMPYRGYGRGRRDVVRDVDVRESGGVR